jgi:hypothetical protein
MPPSRKCGPPQAHRIHARRKLHEFLVHYAAVCELDTHPMSYGVRGMASLKKMATPAIVCPRTSPATACSVNDFSVTYSWPWS